MKRDGYMCIIRHGERIDKVDKTWKKFSERPYDPPLAETSLPKLQSQSLQTYNFTRIITSPLLRCLETASVLSEQLNITQIEVNYGLTEVMSISRRGFKGEIEYEDQNKRLGLCENVEYKNIPPSQDEKYIEGMFRYRYILEGIRKKYPEENIIVVTHGAALVAAGYLSNPRRFIYSSKSCSYVIVDRNWNLVATNRDNSVNVFALVLIFIWVWIREFVDIFLAITQR